MEMCARQEDGMSSKTDEIMHDGSKEGASSPRARQRTDVWVETHRAALVAVGAGTAVGNTSSAA